VTFDDDLPAPRGASDAERGIAVDQIAAALDGFEEPSEALTLGEVNWRPDLIRGTDAVVHLSLDGELPRVFLRRLEAAADEGYAVFFATSSLGLDLDTLVALQDLDAGVVFLNFREEGIQVDSYKSVADWIALRRIALAPDEMARLVRQRLEAGAGTGTNAARGRWFEEALCLLFSQVSWLEVEEHGYTNASEEIDLVLSARGGGYLARLAKGPIVIGTAKNEDSATGSSVVKYLKEQMANRKGRCRLGFLCSATTISKKAKIEILRGSQSGDFVIVELARAEIDDLLDNADDLDEKLVALIVRAINE